MTMFPTLPRRFLVCCASLVLGLAVAARAAHAGDLPLTPDEIAAVFVEAGLLAPGDFAPVDDPHVGSIVVGRAEAPADPDAPRPSPISVVIIPGESGVSQVQVIMAAPWADLVARVEAVARLAGLVMSGPEAPAALPDDPVVRQLDPMGHWVFGVMMEAWLGWPSPAQRVVRARDGVALIVEGTPPELWAVTLAPDEGWPDATWPGPYAESDPPALTEARALIRRGEDAAAHELLVPLAREHDVAAAANLLGDMARFGRLGMPQIEASADWYLIAARQRYPDAILSLATTNNEGWGVFFYNNLRMPLLVDAANYGSPGGLYLLAGAPNSVNYVRPEGVTSADQVLEAARWGLPIAQLDIAQRLAAGEGIAPDPVAAHAWSLAAVASTGPGLDWIAVRRIEQELRAAFDVQQLTASRRLADELVTGPPAWPQVIENPVEQLVDEPAGDAAQ